MLNINIVLYKFMYQYITIENANIIGNIMIV